VTFSFTLKFPSNVNTPVLLHASAPILDSDTKDSMDFPMSGNLSTTVFVCLLIVRERKFLAAKALAFCLRTLLARDFLFLETILFTPSEATEVRPT